MNKDKIQLITLIIICIAAAAWYISFFTHPAEVYFFLKNEIQISGSWSGNYCTAQEIADMNQFKNFIVCITPPNYVEYGATIVIGLCYLIFLYTIRDDNENP